MAKAPAFLRERIAFDQPIYTPDGSGGRVRTWAQQFETRAQFIYSRGSEAVDAARLQGRSIYKIKVRSSTASRAVTTDWRMRDIRRETPYNIREVDAITDPAWVYLVVEAGVAI